MADPILDATLLNLLIQGGFAALFVWLLADSRRDSRNREAKLTEHLDRYYATLPQIVKTLEKMEERQERMDERLERIENNMERRAAAK